MSAASDLSKEEQINIRTALRFLHIRFGGWIPLGKALKMPRKTVAAAAGGRTVSARLAFRLARLVGVGIDELLVGRFPAPNACPYCGHIPSQPVEEHVGP